MPKVAKGGSSGQPRKAAPTCLYLGCFSFDLPGEREEEGTFQILVDAPSPEDAVEQFQRRLRKLRTTTTLFDDPSTIYLIGLIQLGGSFKNGLLVNWEHGDAPPDPNMKIGCLIPEQKDHECVEYGYTRAGKGKRGKKDEDMFEPFVDFGGEKFREALEKSKGGAEGSPPAHSGRAAADVGRLLREASDGRKAEARANKETATRARAEAQAKKARAAALGATLDELRPSNRRGRGGQ
jgi:hypothetical protein